MVARKDLDEFNEIKNRYKSMEEENKMLNEKKSEYTDGRKSLEDKVNAVSIIDHENLRKCAAVFRLHFSCFLEENRKSAALG